MNTRFHLSITVIILFLGIFFVHRGAEASILSVSPKQDEVELGSTFVVDVHLSSETEVINAIETVITYPTDSLELVEASTGGSMLTLWVTEPLVDPSQGEVTLAGGIPNGSYVEDGLIVRLTFRARGLGTAEVRFTGTSSSVRRNDGEGTKTPLSFSAGTYEIVLPSEYAVLLQSTSHPDEDAWYPNRTFLVSWDLREGAQYSFTVDSDPRLPTDDIPEETTGREAFENLADGIHYFILKERRTGEEWRVVARRRVQIDTTPPEAFTAVVTRQPDLYSGAYYAVFATTDFASGVDSYEVSEGNHLARDVSSPYVLTNQSFSGRIVVRAFDRAGNIRESTITPPSSFPSATKRNLYWVGIAAIVLLAGGALIIFRKKHA